MAHTRRTLKLDDTGWDLVSDGNGRIVLANGAEATAQNVANECRLFTEDAYFCKDRGIPHFLVELGQKLNPSVLRSYLRKAALGVPDVSEVLAVEVNGVDQQSRVLTGDIQFKTVEDKEDAQVRTYF